MREEDARAARDTPEPAALRRQPLLELELLVELLFELELLDETDTLLEFEVELE